jgi:hypothetical protein
MVETSALHPLRLQLTAYSGVHRATALFLFPVSCSLSLFPIPCPYSLFPIPYSLFPVPWSLYGLYIQNDNPVRISKRLYIQTYNPFVMNKCVYIQGGGYP